MTKDDIIRMARDVWTLDIGLIGICNLEAFAALVAAHKREELQAEIDRLKAENKLYKEAAVFFSRNQ